MRCQHCGYVGYFPACPVEGCGLPFCPKCGGHSFQPHLKGRHSEVDGLAL